MPDNITNRGPQDRSRISLLEPHKVQSWADKFNVSKERLSEAVKNVGHSADAVERELRNSVSSTRPIPCLDTCERFVGLSIFHPLAESNEQRGLFGR